MSVINDNTDELITEFNELESKVFVLIEALKKVETRLKALEAIAKKHGHEVSEGKVEADVCTIN